LAARRGGFSIGKINVWWETKMKKWMILFLVFAVAGIAWAAWDGSTNFPGSLDTSATLYDVEDLGNIEDEHHDALAQAAIAIETKVGTGASTPAANKVLCGNGVGTSAWEEVALTTDTSGNYVASVATTSPLGGGAAGSEGATLTLTINDASTTGKGAAQFDADNFNVASGVVTLDIQTKGFIINAATTADDFLIWRTPQAITITNIHGVLQSGTNVVGGLDECDSNGANPVAVDSDITFDGSLDSDDGSLTNPSIDAGDWIKWHTTSVSSPGYLTVTVYYTID